MPQFKTLLVTAALIAAPSLAIAQSSATGAADFAKEKAVDTVLENATGEDAFVAGKTVLQGGSQTDAAVAVVKNRANKRIESVTDGVGLEDLSTDGALEAGKEIAVNQAQSSASTYTNGVTGGSTSGVLGAGQALVTQNAPSSAVTYSGDKAQGLLNKGAPVIHKSGATSGAIAAPSVTAPAASTITVNCPAGTKDAGDGTCMITGDWRP